MIKAIINFLFTIGCVIGSLFIKDETWRGVFIGGAFTSALVLIESVIENWSFLSLLFVTQTYRRRKLLRFSISYLYRIKVDDKYLLVRGKRIDQFQPVGGVYKRHPESKIRLNELGVLDDDCMPIDDDSRDDLRVRVPGTNAVAFIKWFNAKQGRELSRYREFCEELILPGILSTQQFPYVDYSHIKTVQKGIHFSQHFQCYEYLIADIIELRPTAEQLVELRKLMANASAEYVWVNANTIKRRGYNPDAGLNLKISETSEWIL
jgi:hypothetical protein